MINIQNFIPPILTKKNWSDRLLRYKKSKLKNSINYEENNYFRTAFIHRAIIKKGIDCKYLEIGCDQNAVFNTIPLDKKNKIGVDPISGGTHRMNSDEFFRDNRENFDIIFIDGLHTYKQVQRDAINSIKFLKKDGIIFFHDLLPRDEIDEEIKFSGDCWKAGIELSQSNGLNLKIVNIDCGVGILKKNNFMNINTWIYKIKFTMIFLISTKKTYVSLIPKKHLNL